LRENRTIDGMVFIAATRVKLKSDLIRIVDRNEKTTFFSCLIVDSWNAIPTDSNWAKVAAEALKNLLQCLQLSDIVYKYLCEAQKPAYRK